MSDPLSRILEQEAKADAAMFVVLPPEKESGMEPIRVHCRRCDEVMLIGRTDSHARFHGETAITLDNRQMRHINRKNT